ncbi:MAG: hypothetical protein ACXACY_28690, partial [Candidatus Hodarchaeales archaeon]|jgi:hypothetical protein
MIVSEFKVINYVNLKGIYVPHWEMFEQHISGYMEHSGYAVHLGHISVFFDRFGGPIGFVDRTVDNNNCKYFIVEIPDDEDEKDTEEIELI